MQHMITNVTALYPRLNATYKFDTTENKSVKCDALDEGAAFEMSFKLSSEQAKELHQICSQAYANASAMDTKRTWPDKPSNLPYKQHKETGEITGKCKLKGSYGGDKTQPPKQVDAARNRLPDDFMLTSDSKVNIAVMIVPYNTGSLNGVSLRLRAVQVLELAEMSGGDDPFDSVSGFVSPNTDATFSNTQPVAPATNGVAYDPFAPVPAQSVSNNVLDDEIPF
jgi:hypothetical protein|tara:strand:- start:7281 stop:7952 length:672 start_codon:yes stop_codon:yes gene_type:complete